MGKEEKKNTSVSTSIRNFIDTLKKRFVIVIAIIVVACGAGVAASYIRKPNYVASRDVTITVDQATIKDEVNIMIGIVDTVADFCTQGNVVDRANFYYVQYLNSGKTLDEFCDSLDLYDIYPTDEDAIEDMNKKTDRKIFKENISVDTTVTDNSTDFYFVIKYTDSQPDKAAEKVRLIVKALNNEVNEKVIDNGTEVGKYFPKAEVKIHDLDHEGAPVPDVSKTKIIVIATVAGVALAVVVIYLISILDNTVKTKEDLEEATGVKLLASVSKIGGER